MDTDIAHLKSRKRPQSRASTTSIHSAKSQPNPEQADLDDALDSYPNEWNPADELNSGPDLTPEAAVLHAAAQLRAGGRGFSADIPVDSSAGHPTAYQSDQADQEAARHSMVSQVSSTDGYPGHNSFGDADSHMQDARDDEGAADSFSRPISSKASANNEFEMRQLFQANRHRKLPDVARELHGNERGPNSERTRQVFAMLWLNTVCSRGKGSVPRGRVYANYASRCATERITVLNPASFGKLVRVLFPGLRTRRLGVRGESKYHYVNFTLTDDQPDGAEPDLQLVPALPELSSLSQSFNTAPIVPAVEPAERSLLPSPELAQPPASPAPSNRSHVRSHSLYNQPDVPGIDQLHPSSAKTVLKLSFASGMEDPQHSEPIVLPRLEPFLPSGTDADAAKSLSALYRSHCTSLVECIRYCKEKTFFHLFTSFQGTLTMPVQRLLGHPDLAPWIEECDFVLYQRMMHIISALTLQVLPKPVLDTLRNISERLVPHIRESFQGQPQHVIRAKEAPATIFAALLDRVLRVNLTAHAAANMLSNPANRDQMYHDWISMVRVRKVAECVPAGGMDDLVKLLLLEIRDLLDPVNIPWDIECMTIYGDIALRHGRQPGTERPADPSTQNVLDRWVGFLRSLPNHFSYATTTDIVWCVQRVGTAIMRDLTLSQGKSFGSWWVTKCWIDEMICFMAEQGGFMKQKSSRLTPRVAKSQAVNQEANKQGSRCSTGSEDLDFPNLNHALPDKARLPPPPSRNSGMEMNGTNQHDDSGIGIQTPEEDFPMEKFALVPTEDQGLLVPNSLQHLGTTI